MLETRQRVTAAYSVRLFDRSTRPLDLDTLARPQVRCVRYSKGFNMLRDIQGGGRGQCSRRPQLAFKDAVNTVVPRSPVFASCTPKYCRLQKYSEKRFIMSASMKWRHLEHFQLLSRAVSAFKAVDRNGTQSTRRDG